KLKRDLAGKPIDLFWITHQHVDHIGGAADVMKKLPVKTYVDNGRQLDVSWVKKARTAAANRKVSVLRFSPAVVAAPLAPTPQLRLRAIVPPAPLPACEKDENDCS